MRAPLVSSQARSLRFESSPLQGTRQVTTPVFHTPIKLGGPMHRVPGDLIGWFSPRNPGISRLSPQGPFRDLAILRFRPGRASSYTQVNPSLPQYPMGLLCEGHSALHHYSVRVRRTPEASKPAGPNPSQGVFCPPLHEPGIADLIRFGALATTGCPLVQVSEEPSFHPGGRYSLARQASKFGGSPVPHTISGATPARYFTG